MYDNEARNWQRIKKKTIKEQETAKRQLGHYRKKYGNKKNRNETIYGGLKNMATNLRNV